MMLRNAFLSLLLLLACAWTSAEDRSYATGGAVGGGSVVSTAGLTANTVTKATAAGTIGNSQITDNGTNISINPAGTLSLQPTGVLSVGGSSTTAANTWTFTAPVLGTPASATLTNATGLPVSTGISGLGTGVATFLATPSTANLASAVTGATGSGALVFGTSPTLGGTVTVGAAAANGLFIPQSGKQIQFGAAPTTADAIADTIISTITTTSHRTLALQAMAGQTGELISGQTSTGTNIFTVFPNAGVTVMRLYNANNISNSISSGEYATTSVGDFAWSNSSVSASTSGQTYLTSPSAAIVRVNGAASAPGDFQLTQSILTSGTPTVTTNSVARVATTKYTVSNANVVALGASNTGDITIATIPARMIIRSVVINVTGAAAGVTTLTGSCGITGAAYIDYVGVSDMKSATNYNALTANSLPSMSGTTALKAHFISTGSNLSAVTGFSGEWIVEAEVLPIHGSFNPFERPETNFVGNFKPYFWSGDPHPECVGHYANE